MVPDIPVTTHTMKRAVGTGCDGASENVQGDEARHGCIASRLKKRCRQLAASISKQNASKVTTTILLIKSMTPYQHPPVNHLNKTGMKGPETRA